MGNRIISISRQFGSGGHEVAVKQRISSASASMSAS